MCRGDGDCEASSTPWIGGATARDSAGQSTAGTSGYSPWRYAILVPAPFDEKPAAAIPSYVMDIATVAESNCVYSLSTRAAALCRENVGVAAIATVQISFRDRAQARCG